MRIMGLHTCQTTRDMLMQKGSEMATGNYTEERVSIGETDLYLTKGGSGAPVLVATWGRRP